MLQSNIPPFTTEHTITTSNNREHRQVFLPTGVLDVTVTNSDLSLDDLCGFAARRNPKRGFLFVSKVLGKHIPARPSLMRSAQRTLAAKIAVDLPGPVVIIGMAETAIGLGQGVFEEYIKATGRNDVLFIHSTRYRLNHPTALEFLEEHSHAADHIIYLPAGTCNQQLFQQARSLVLVDDEASTGKTFVNLTRAFKASIPSLEHVVTVVITDWRGEERLQATNDAMPVPSTSLSVLSGNYSFSPAPNLVAVHMPKVVGNGTNKDDLLVTNYGRLGVNHSLSLPNLSALLKRPIGKNERCLILGTGEFAYPPFLLAEMLEESGMDVHYQSTTRSPIMAGQAIGTTLTFTDNYNDGIPNFLYNARADDYERIIVCHETPACTLDTALLQALKAENLEF